MKPEIKELPVELITPPLLTLRTKIDRNDIQELSKSIAAMGLIEPLVVNKVGDKFTLIAGFRRLEAVKLLNWQVVPCILTEQSQDHSIACSLHENIFRVDMNPIDEGRVFHHLNITFGLSLTRIAELIGKSTGYVSQRLTATNWPAHLQDSVQDGKLSFSVARELAKVTDPEHQTYLTDIAIKGGATARVVDGWVREWFDRHTPGPVAPERDATADITHPPEVAYAKCFFCKEDSPVDKFITARLCPKCCAHILHVQQHGTPPPE